MLDTIITLDGHIQSIYLAVYPDKLLLLDGCCRPDVPMVLKFIRQNLKRPVSDLKVVMVTHMHPDHAGGAHKLRQETGCLIVSAAKDQPWYGGIGGRMMHLVDTGLAYYVAHRQQKPIKNLWYPAILNADILVSHGDSIPKFEDWQVIETHGHTDRDLSLWHKATGQIYTADLIIKLRHKFVAPFPIYDPKVYIESLQKIKALKPSCVLMAHGGKLAIDEATFDMLIMNSPKQPRTVKDTIIHKLRRRGGSKGLFKS